MLLRLCRVFLFCMFPFVLFITLAIVLRRNMKVVQLVTKQIVQNDALLKLTAVFSTLLMILVYGVSSAEWSQQGNIAAIATLLVVYITATNSNAANGSAK